MKKIKISNIKKIVQKNRKFTIYDYKKTPKEVVINNWKMVDSILLEKISGDLIMKVCYKDGTSEQFDSSTSRCINFYDGLRMFPKEGFSQRKIDKFYEGIL